MISHVPVLVVLLVYALATYRLTRLVVRDEIFSPIRERIWKNHPPERSKLGFLLTCEWCSSFWLAIPCAVGFVFNDTITFIIALVLAFSAITGIVQSLLDR